MSFCNFFVVVIESKFHDSSIWVWWGNLVENLMWDLCTQITKRFLKVDEEHVHHCWSTLNTPSTIDCIILITIGACQVALVYVFLLSIDQGKLLVCFVCQVEISQTMVCLLPCTWIIGKPSLMSRVYYWSDFILFGPKVWGDCEFWVFSLKIE